MRSAWLVALIAGCGFSSPVTDDPADPGDPIDPGDPGDPADPGDPGTPVARCDVSDPSLRLCLTFDHTPMVQDLAAPPHAPLEATGVRTIAAPGDIVAGFDGASRLRFAEAADLDVAELTIDMLILPSRIGQRQTFRMLDNNTQYFVSYDDDEHVRCGVGDRTVRTEDNLRSGWHHIACRYDLASQQLRVYLDGDVNGCTPVAAIPTTGGNGLAVGASYSAAGFRDNFIGVLDDLHLYARALPDADICRAARRTNCRTTCPGQDQGPDLHRPRR